MRFGKGETAITKLTCIIIIELQKGNKQVEIGIVVDSVSEVINLAKDEIEQTPEFGDDVRADFISGMGRIGNKFIIMLNVSRVLNVQDINFIEKAAIEGRNMMSGNKKD
jgi:purine-binding chemotaxis protein CheW